MGNTIKSIREVPLDIERYLEEKRIKIDRALDGFLPKENDFPQSLHKAMRYSVFAGGKRLRPIFTLAAAEAVGGYEEDVLPAAWAVELIHAYSLIHDDLPSMDDDDLRRGKPTCHKVFGEAVAILAGDALLTLAFGILAQLPVKNEVGAQNILLIIREMAKAAGSQGMVGGQVVDIESEGKKVEFPLLEYIHIHKTGELILASIRAGAILSRAGDRELEALTHYGEAVGLSFQITDDILDVEGDRERMGKEVGMDAVKGKATYPSVIGIEESKRRVKELTDIALSSISELGSSAEPLRLIARFISQRTE